MGFLIDAVATWDWFLCVWPQGWMDEDRSTSRTHNDYLAEFNNHTVSNDIQALDHLPVLSLVVWTLKREVRASGECLGMYRR